MMIMISVGARFGNTNGETVISMIRRPKLRTKNWKRRCTHTLSLSPVVLHKTKAHGKVNFPRLRGGNEAHRKVSHGCDGKGFCCSILVRYGPSYQAEPGPHIRQLSCCCLRDGSNVVLSHQLKIIYFLFRRQYEHACFGLCLPIPFAINHCIFHLQKRGEWLISANRAVLRVGNCFCTYAHLLSLGSNCVKHVSVCP